MITCFLMLGFFAEAQEKVKVTQLADSICAYYNNSQYRQLHNLLSPEFQKDFSEEQMATFFGEKVKPGFGKVKEIKFLHNRQDAENYLLTCEKGKLQMVLYATGNYKVAGMQWLPYMEENMPLKKKASYVSDDALITELDVKVDSAVRDYMLSGSTCGLSIAIYKDGNYSYYNFGETTRGNKTLPTRNSMYEIGSITKTFTGILLAQAVTEGKLKLKDDIRNYLPGKYPNLNFKGQPILIENLANHTSRIPSVPGDYEKQPGYDPLNPYKNYNRKMIFEFLKTVVPDTVPGDKNEYSNTGVAVLGLILEKVYNKPYSELVEEYIVKPNGFTSTKVKLQSEDLKNKVSGYNEEGTQTPYWDLNDFAAAGAINSTSKELLDYFVWNMNETTEAVKLSHQRTWGTERYGVALGWHLAKTRKGYSMVWHNGGTYGFKSFGAFIKEKNCAVVVLSNSGAGVDPIALAILKYLQQ